MANTTEQRLSRERTRNEKYSWSPDHYDVEPVLVYSNTSGQDRVWALVNVRRFRMQKYEDGNYYQDGVVKTMHRFLMYISKTGAERLMGGSYESGSEYGPVNVLPVPDVRKLIKYDNETISFKHAEMLERYYGDVFGKILPEPKQVNVLA